VNTHFPSHRRSTFALLPVVTIAAAIAVFIGDTIAHPAIAVGVLYVPVVLLAARFCEPRTLPGVAGACVALVVVSYVLTGGDEAATANLVVSIATIALTTLLVVQQQSAVRHRKQAEDALREAQAALAHVTRVTTLGEVTASLAHELNQPLAAIVNNATASVGLLADGGPEIDEVRDAVTDIIADAERASAIIERVRALAKRSPPERAPLRVADLVDDVLAISASQCVARRVTIASDVAADLPVVLGDRVQLQQVLLNLILNAIDAMATVEEPDRKLEIRARPDTHGGPSAVRISVIDRGVGFGEMETSRLFEPFYTTKPNGMGIGLAISRTIVEAHRGRLWAEPNHGRGATFSIVLPTEGASAA